MKRFAILFALLAGTAEAATLENVRVFDSGPALVVRADVIGSEPFNGNPGWTVRVAFHNEGVNAPAFEYVVKVDRTCDGSQAMSVYRLRPFARMGETALLVSDTLRVGIPWIAIGGRPAVSGVNWDVRWNDFAPLIPGTAYCREIGPRIVRGRLEF